MPLSTWKRCLVSAWRHFFRRSQSRPLDFGNEALLHAVLEYLAPLRSDTAFHLFLQRESRRSAQAEQLYVRISEDWALTAETSLRSSQRLTENRRYSLGGRAVTVRNGFDQRSFSFFNTACEASTVLSVPFSISKPSADCLSQRADFRLTELQFDFSTARFRFCFQTHLRFGRKLQPRNAVPQFLSHRVPVQLYLECTAQTLRHHHRQKLEAQFQLKRDSPQTRASAEASELFAACQFQLKPTTFFQLVLQPKLQHQLMEFSRDYDRLLELNCFTGIE